MSFNSLVNFGVPGLGGQRSPKLQPHLTNRFRVLFYNFGDPGDTAPYDLTRAIKSAGRPNANFSETQLYSYLSISHIITRLNEFEPINISFDEDIDNQVLTRCMQQVSKQQNFFDQTASRAGENYKFEIDIDMLAGGATAGDSATDPNVLVKHCLVGCQLVNLTTTDLSYESADKTSIDISVRCDNYTTFDNDGNVLGNFDHSPEIETENGSVHTGVGGAGNTPGLFSA